MTPSPLRACKGGFQYQRLKRSSPTHRDEYFLYVEVRKPVVRSKCGYNVQYVLRNWTISSLSKQQRRYWLGRLITLRYIHALQFGSNAPFMALIQVKELVVSMWPSAKLVCRASLHNGWKESLKSEGTAYRRSSRVLIVKNRLMSWPSTSRLFVGKLPSKPLHL